MDFDGVRLEVEDRTATVTLARPEKRNALSLDTLQNLIKAFEAVPSDVGVVVLAAEGKVFSAGHDMSEMIDRPDEYYTELFDTCVRMMESVHALPQPVIARVQGVATAAGCQLVASCDLAVAADDTWFATPGVSIGLFCSTPMVPVSRAVGHKRAMQMLLTGEPISAAQAVEWGLINQAVPAEELDDAVAELAGKILRFSSHTIAMGKEAYYAQAELPEDSAYKVTSPVMAANAATTDAQEGMTAFLEKRDPEWTGRD
ncbi:MAG: enoyl-CoA hydratase [Acidimicrobiia bacterium]|jgi:enoyl-CoA hydratase/carnithine racemase